jgi:hypothetical protein
MRGWVLREVLNPSDIKVQTLNSLGNLLAVTSGNRFSRFPGSNFRTPVAVANLCLLREAARDLPGFVRVVQIKKGLNISAMLKTELFLPTI